MARIASTMAPRPSHNAQLSPAGCSVGLGTSVGFSTGGSVGVTLFSANPPRSSRLPAGNMIRSMMRSPLPGTVRFSVAVISSGPPGVPAVATSM